MQLKEEECPCPKTDCERRCDCVVCRNHHESQPNPAFCKRPGAVLPDGLEDRVIARLRAAGMPLGGDMQ